MYTYNTDKEMYVFDGDLEEFLISKGVDKSHIKDMQQKILQEDRGAYQNFPDESSYISLVPLDKVIGTSRGTVGWSVYDNVKKMYDSDREPGRFKSCFEYFDGMLLEKLKKSYEELVDPVKMVYYVDDDEYYLSSDGNHRTLVAMLVGAKNIKAKVTNAYCNVIKKRRYEYVRAFEKKYGVYRIMEWWNSYDITFYDENGYYEIKGYKGPNQDEDLFAFLDRLSAEIDTDKMKVKKIERLPSFIRRYILNKKENYRLKEYVEKEYLSGDDLIFWKNRQPVFLENL